MDDALENQNLQYKLGVVRWVGVGIVAAGLVFVLVTGNPKHLNVLILAGLAAYWVDYFVKKVRMPTRLPSLHTQPDLPKAKFRVGPLMYVGFTVLLVSLIFFSRPRILAALMLASLCIFLFNRPVRSRS